MNEVWKAIPDYEGYYEVSNTGKVKSLGLTKWSKCKELSQFNHKYLRVALSKDKVKSWVSVHRLVAITFIPNPDNLPEVNHKDGNKLNNNDWNLEWKTSRGNKDHAIDNNLYTHGEAHHKSKLTELEVLEIHQWLIKRVRTQDIADKYKISKDVIDGIKSGIYWRYLKLPIVKTRGVQTNKKLLYE